MEVDKCFRVLDLEPMASFDQVKDSYKVFSQLLHPDKQVPGTKAHSKALEKQKQINDAYDRLKKYFVFGDNHNCRLATERIAA